ncbi:YggS family pyridoxal phosphate-dependent enzyme, partial [Klebsiella pneumoniae]
MNTRRAEELAAALKEITDRIERACQRVGRSSDEVRLIAVTKTFPAADAAALLDLGVRNLGENRDQEAAAKVREVEELRPDTDVRWHMVGRLQRNKARPVARWAAEVQSVDSLRLADAL